MNETDSRKNPASFDDDDGPAVGLSGRPNGYLPARHPKAGRAYSRAQIADMAGIVSAIAAGDWTSDCPAWADAYDADTDGPVYDASTIDDDDDANGHYTRAVQTAEVFIVLLEDANGPTFDRAAFLLACGFTVAISGKRERIAR